MTKSSASDNLLHVNCNVTNRTQTCFRRLFTRCVGTSVILKALLFLCCYCWKSASHICLSFVLFFRCSAVCFGAFCTEGNAVGFKFRFDMRYSTKFVKSHSAKCSLHTWAWWGAALTSARLKCTNLIYFRLTAGRFRGNSCIVMFWVACELLQFAATQ